MSFRRSLVSQFDPNLKPYWRRFEDDAIYPIYLKNYKVLYDPAIQVYHHTAPIQEGTSREHSPESIWGSHHNNTYVMLKHLNRLSKKICFLGFTFLIGDSANLGFVGYLGKAAKRGTWRKVQNESIHGFSGKLAGLKTYMDSNKK